MVSDEASVLECGTLNLAISDHLPIYILTKLKAPKTPNSYATMRSYKNYDPNIFCSHLATKADDLISIFSEVDVNKKTKY